MKQSQSPSYTQTDLSVNTIKIELSKLYLTLRNMGNQSKRSQTKEYYQKSGNIHVSVFGGLIATDQDWPTPPQGIGLENYTLSGRWFCDQYGIPRNGNWCKIGDLSSKRQDLFKDIFHYYLKPEK